MEPSASPAYSLADMQAKIRIGHYAITTTARAGAASLGFDESDITECVCTLSAGHFYKSMPSESVPGTFQDVYRTEWDGKAIYAKLTLGAVGRRTVVISFKRDESASPEEDANEDN
jgi:hypothetical protein